MADGGVDIDLYADDIESDFNRQDEFGGENVDLYDDVIAAPASKPEDGDGPPVSSQHAPEETNGNASYHHNGPSHGHHGRRFQLYVGNLTWSLILVYNEPSKDELRLLVNAAGETPVEESMMKPEQSLLLLLCQALPLVVTSSPMFLLSSLIVAPILLYDCSGLVIWTKVPYLGDAGEELRQLKIYW